MKKNRNRGIRFEMDFESDLERQLVAINDNNAFIKKVTVVRNQLRFPIPKEIVQNLDLKPNEPCYFTTYPTGTLLVFKEEPSDISKEYIIKRKLLKAGMYDTLYLVIPKKLSKKYTRDIKRIHLLHIKEYKDIEWQIQFLFTEYI